LPPAVSCTQRQHVLEFVASRLLPQIFRDLEFLDVVLVAPADFAGIQGVGIVPNLDATAFLEGCPSGLGVQPGHPLSVERVSMSSGDTRGFSTFCL
jgi:hypothetical protein